MPGVRIGTAGWTIPRLHAQTIPGEGSHLERYSRTLSCAEINSSFYRPSRESTWRRWAASVRADFRFAVKAPKTITHEAGLELTAVCTAALSTFLDQAQLLGPKLGPLLFQLPPKQSFNASRAAAFFEHLRNVYQGAIVLEPRHETWFSAEAAALLSALRIARAAADPPPVADASDPGGFEALVYYRLHGSPKKYYSEYSERYLLDLAARIQERSANTEAWVIFDNTASGAALGNALMLLSALRNT
jgi:uncharacterized protein YecE (DUF72 family)